MRLFKWIEWNLQKIDAHTILAEEVEAAFDRVFRRSAGNILPVAELARIQARSLATAATGKFHSAVRLKA